jgi:hypothetical protein
MSRVDNAENDIIPLTCASHVSHTADKMSSTVSEVWDPMFPLVSLIQPFLDICSLYQLSLCSKRTRQLCNLLVQQDPSSILSAASSYNSNKPRLLAKSVNWACHAAGADACCDAAIAAAVAQVPLPAAVRAVLMTAGVCPTLQHIFQAASHFPLGLEGWVVPHNSNWVSFPAILQAVCQNDMVRTHMQSATC